MTTTTYKRKNLIGAGLQYQSYSLFSSWKGAWWPAGRHVPEEVHESSTSESAKSRKKRKASEPGLGSWNTKAHPQWYTSSNKAHQLILSNSTTSWQPRIQIHEPMRVIVIQATRLPNEFLSCTTMTDILNNQWTCFIYCKDITAFLAVSNQLLAATSTQS